MQVAQCNGRGFAWLAGHEESQARPFTMTPVFLAVIHFPIFTCISIFIGPFHVATPH